MWSIASSFFLFWISISSEFRQRYEENLKPESEINKILFKMPITNTCWKPKLKANLNILKTQIKTKPKLETRFQNRN